MDSTNRRVARNAVALALRMIFVTGVGLYTSRLVLEALGVDDYGIYGVVGGVIMMASFLNMSMSAATSRFITFEVGRGDYTKLRQIFSTAMYIHIGLALIVLVAAETLGLWFVNCKMVIPPDRLFAANVVYQLSIATMIVNFTQIPYTAEILAHERMGIYAWFEVSLSMLKFISVICVLKSHTDHLILYAVLIFAVTTGVALGQRIYCRRKFEEAHMCRRIDRDVARGILSFSTYDLYGTLCVVSRDQGVPILINLFYGVAVNAVGTIAHQVLGSVTNLTTSIFQAFRPQIIKQYAAGRIDLMNEMMRRSTLFTYLAFGIILIPFLLDTHLILYIWLGQVPEYCVVFVRLVLLTGLFNISIYVTGVGIHATGNIKALSFVNGTLYLLCPVITYIVFRMGSAPQIAYVVELCILGLVTPIGWGILKHQIPDLSLSALVRATLLSVACIGLGLAVTYWVSTIWPLLCPATYPGFWTAVGSLAVTTIIGAIVTAAFALAIAFNAGERRALLSTLRTRLHI